MRLVESALVGGDGQTHAELRPTGARRTTSLQRRRRACFPIRPPSRSAVPTSNGRRQGKEEGDGRAVRGRDEGIVRQRPDSTKLGNRPIGVQNSVWLVKGPMFAAAAGYAAEKPRAPSNRSSRRKSPLKFRKAREKPKDADERRIICTGATLVEIGLCATIISVILDPVREN